MPIKAVLNRARVPIKIWSDLATVESSALDQLINTANLPFVFKHVAAMPDVHLGHGATVGSVIATKCAICPAAVGVDIGCGMMAIKTDLNAQVVQDNIVKIRASIERSVPVGHAGNNRILKSVEDWGGWSLIFEALGNKCCKCDFSDMRAVQVDHISGSGAVERRSYSGISYLN